MVLGRGGIIARKYLLYTLPLRSGRHGHRSRSWTNCRPAAGLRILRRPDNRTIDYSGLAVVENIIDPQEVLDTPEEYVLVGEESTDTLVTEPQNLLIRSNIRRKYALKASLRRADMQDESTQVHHSCLSLRFFCSDINRFPVSSRYKVRLTINSS